MICLADFLSIFDKIYEKIKWASSSAWLERSADMIQSKDKS